MATSVPASISQSSRVDTGARDAVSIDPKVVRELAELAESMTKDENIAIFRRFEELTILNILLLQEQLRIMGEELMAIKASGNPATDTEDGYSVTYGFGVNAHPPAQNITVNEFHAKREDLQRRISHKIREYNGSLLELAQLRNLGPPDSGDVLRLQRHLRERPETLQLPDASRSCWDDSNLEDLIVLRSDISKGNRFIMKLRFLLDSVYWELWGHKKAETMPEDGNVITVGKSKRHISKAELAKRSAFTSRLLMSLFGGIALIVPTIIMAKHQDVNTSLITTSIATVAFAAILAIGATDSTGKDVLGATAAYTAVLVVFVGTSLAGPSSTSESAGGSNLTRSGV